MKSIELFAGAGGSALGLERAGFEPVALVEIDRHACRALRGNRPYWNVLQEDIRKIDFREYSDIDLISAGFPLNSLFEEFLRAVKEVKPKAFLVEDLVKSKAFLERSFSDLDYVLSEPKVLDAIDYSVPQKRKRLFFVGFRNDLAERLEYNWPIPHPKKYVLRDALKAGELYATDVPPSARQSYSQRRKEILDLVPPGGWWKDLPEDLQKEYLKKSFFLRGGKTGIARRLSWDEPCLTIMGTANQKQTDRCHPDETRPLTIRECARIQTFPDDWAFSGPIISQYKQVGNAVPVNLAQALGQSIAQALNQAS